MPAEKGVEQPLLFTDQSLIFVKAARAFSAMGLLVTKMQSSRSDQTIDVQLLFTQAHFKGPSDFIE